MSANQEYTKYEIRHIKGEPAVLLALMGELAFEAFQELEDGIDAFVPTENAVESLDQQLEDLKKRLSFDFVKTIIPPHNWNETWEKNFEPIMVKEADCFVRAAFHPPSPDASHEIVIDPKMAFGTGHHATTYLMLAEMTPLSLKNKRLLDYGCGTGILSIFAAKLGAEPIHAVDIEQPAYENTLENLEINKVDQVSVWEGDLSAVPPNTYQVILANINRNVILNSLPALYNRLEERGILLISGILEEDEDLVTRKAVEVGFKNRGRRQRMEWICLKLERK